MAEQENVSKVREAYETFQRADIPALLGLFSEDIEWDTPGTPGQIPYAGRVRGHAEVGQFFAKLAETEDINHFEPREFIAQGERVVVLGNYRGRVRATNKAYDIDWLHVFTVRGGKQHDYSLHGPPGAASCTARRPNRKRD